jgi:hypothetical protein
MTAKKVYAWGGWKMPILHLNDPEYCEHGCPICTRARRGVPWAVAVQKAELALTLGGIHGGVHASRNMASHPIKLCLAQPPDHNLEHIR